MDAKDLQDPNQLYSILHPYITGVTRLQFRDVLHNFNRFISPEQEENKLLQMNKTRLSRHSFENIISILDKFIKKDVTNKLNNYFITIIEYIKSILGKNISKEMKIRIGLIEEKINKISNIDNIILPETNNRTVKQFIMYYKYSGLDYDKKKEADNVLDKINEIYIKEAKTLKSMIQALIL